MLPREHDGRQGKWHTFQMDDVPAAVLEGMNVRNHICFLMPQKALEKITAQVARPRGGAQRKQDLQRMLNTVPLAQLMEHGEFHMGGSFLKDSQSQLLLPFGSMFRDDVFLWVGGYVGDCVYAIETILKSKEKPLTVALKDVFSCHGPFEADDRAEAVEILRDITLTDISNELAKTGITLTPEQVAYCEGLVDKKHCRAPAGSGKSTVGSGLVAAACRRAREVSRKDNRKRKVFYLTPNREQRDDALRAGREVFDNPLQAVGVGRPSDGANTEGNDVMFDSVTEAALFEKLAPIRQALEALEANCMELEKAELEKAHDDTRDDSVVRRLALERFYHKRCELLKAKQAALEDAFRDVDVLYMTVDGFLQLASSASPLSNLVEGSILQLAVIDEAHQLPAARVAAVACAVEEMVSFFDDAQVIDRSCNTVFRKRDVSGEQCGGLSRATIFNWVRCAGVEETAIERIWDWLPKQSLTSLPVSWRCGSHVTSHARMTSKGYGVNDGEEYCPSKGIYTAEELPTYDGSLGHIMPKTFVRATIYRKASFIPCDWRGELLAASVEIPSASDAWGNEERVGASRDIYLGALDEGLRFLHLYQQGKLKMTKKTQVPATAHHYLV